MKKITLIISLLIIFANVLANQKEPMSVDEIVFFKMFSTHALKISCTDSLPKAISAEVKAKNHTDFMAQELNVSAAQKKKICSLNLKRIKSMSVLKTKYKGDMNAAKPEIIPIREKYDANLKSILTYNQWKNWQLILEDRKIKSEEPSKINQYDPTILDSQW